MKFKKITCLILASLLLLTGLSACTDEQEKGPEIVQREIGERYFIFRIWNFYKNTQESFQALVDGAAATGFNAIKIHIPWESVEKTAGSYDYSGYDEMVDYVVNQKKLKVAISIDFSRSEGDPMIPEECIQRDKEGNLCSGGAYYNRVMFSFSCDHCVDMAANFYKNAVKHFNDLYGDDILFYLPAFSQYCETEYWNAGEYDYCDKAIAAFGQYLSTQYPTIDDANKALDTYFISFDKVLAPSCSDKTAWGEAWYKFRHIQLKSVIDRLAQVQKEVCPDSKITIQLGCVWDSAVKKRGTIGFVDLCENVDIIWLDDAPAFNHQWSMDYIRSSLPANVEIAQEIDGPVQQNASKENYRDQGLTSFEREAKYLSIANWGINNDYYEYENVWKEIIQTWLTDNPPEVLKITEKSPVLEIKLSDVFKKGTGKFQKEYEKLAEGGVPVRVVVIDDMFGE